MTTNIYENCIAVIHPDDLGLWTVDLFDEQKRFVKNIGGSYPKSNSCRFDVWLTWSKNIPILLSTYRTIGENEEWLATRDSE